MEKFKVLQIVLPLCLICEAKALTQEGAFFVSVCFKKGILSVLI